MPIITEPESNPRWGFLHGLGAAADDASKIKLYNGPDGRFDQEQFDKLTSVVYQTLDKADKKLAELEQVVEANIKWWTPEFLTPAESAAESIKRFLPDVKSRLAEYRRTINTAANDLDSPLWSGTPGSSGLTSYQQLVANVGFEMKYLYDQKGVLDWAADQTYFKAQFDRATELVKDSYDWFGKGAEELKKLMEDAAKTARDNLEASLWLARNWWKIALAGVAIFYVLPPLIKTGRIYTEKGGSAAAAEFEASLRSGAENITKGTKAAAAAATKAAKAGAAAYTGNPALALTGVRRRSHRRRF